MDDLNQLKDIVKHSTDLWTKGQLREAFEYLDACIAAAEENSQSISKQVLSMHASVIAQSIGDFGLVSRYSEQVMSSKPEDALGNALALYTLADAMFRQGKDDVGRKYAAKSYALVAHPVTREDRGLLELLMKKWPGIADW